eukprot:2988899-Rhodomonas_salina.1
MNPTSGNAASSLHCDAAPSLRLAQPGSESWCWPGPCARGVAVTEEPEQHGTATRWLSCLSIAH